MGGTYEVVGSATSQEGLAVLQVEFDVTDVFGGEDDNGTAPGFFNILHIDGNTLYFGFSGETLEQVMQFPQLNLDVPYFLQ